MKDYLAAATDRCAVAGDPCFDFVAGWINAATGKDARAAYRQDGELDPLRLARRPQQFLRRAQMIADRLDLAPTQQPRDGDIGFLPVLSRHRKRAFAVGIRSGGLWFVKSERGVMAANSIFLKAWSLRG